LIAPNEPISIERQCELLGLSRSSYYYEPCPEKEENLVLMRLLDKQYLDTPYYGIRRMRWFLHQQGYQVNHKKVARLLRLMGLEAIYPKPNLSKANPEHKIYPYLLRGVKVKQVNQVWSTDITYIPMEKGFMYLVAVMDWHSRFVLAWQLSNSLEVDFCLEALETSFQYGQPQIFNSDQGSQFTSTLFTERLLKKEVRISMDGRGRALDNIFIERLWRNVKYEYVYLHAPTNGKELWKGIHDYFTRYNYQRPHQSLNYLTPAQIYFQPDKGKVQNE
jgi:putative transposase